MQALVMTAINELQLHDVPVPTLEQPDWALLRVRASGICGSDLHGYTGQTGRRHPPIVMGHEATADVVAVGAAVRDVRVGDRVAVLPLYDTTGSGQAKDRLGMGMNAPGAYAEYVTWPASQLFVLPPELSYEAGALAEPLAVAVRAVTLASLKPYDTAFVAGAGPIGLLTLAVLRASGVRRVAVSDTSAQRLAYAQQLGASHLINPLEQPPRAVVEAFTNGAGVDVAFEAVGISATCGQTLDVARDRGTIVWIGNNQRQVEIDMQAIVTRELRVLGSYGMQRPDFVRALQLLADGAIATDVLINRYATLSEGPALFPELLTAPNVIKCMFRLDEQ